MGARKLDIYMEFFMCMSTLSISRKVQSFGNTLNNCDGAGTSGGIQEHIEAVTALGALPPGLEPHSRDARFITEVQRQLRATDQVNSYRQRTPWNAQPSSTQEWGCIACNHARGAGYKICM